MRRMLATLAVGCVGGMFGALLVSALPASGSPGDPLVLSAVNQAGPMTVLKSNGGFRILAKNPARPPLMVYTPDSMPPFQVSSPAKVANLNVDLLDGLDSSAFVKASAMVAPVLSFAQGQKTVTVTTDTVVRTITFTPPVDGTVVIGSTARVSASTAGLRVYCSISTSNVLASGYLQEWENPGSSGNAAQLAGTRGFTVVAGAPYTFSLVCAAGGGSAEIRDPVLSLTYVPVS